jgi:hypothetical protein
LVLYQYDGEKMMECPVEKVAEDSAFLYFRTQTVGSSYVAVTGAIAASPWCLAVVIIAVVALIAIIEIYGGYRRFKLTHLREMLRTGYGK